MRSPLTMMPALHARGPVLLPLSFQLLACGLGATEDTAPTTLPDPVDTGSVPLDTDGVPFVVDTAQDTGWDLVPQDTITFEQRGLWTRDLETGGLTGTLLAMEYLNAERPELPDTGDTALDSGADTGAPTGDDTGDTGLEEEEERCLVHYEIVGTPLEDSSCPTCAASWELLFTVVEGNTAYCRDPDLPQDGEIGWFGWDPAQELILQDYQSSGLWLPWWDAMEADELLAIQWVAELAIVLPEEEEE